MTSQTQALEAGSNLAKEAQNDRDSNFHQVFAVPGLIAEGYKGAIGWYLAQGSAPGAGRRAEAESGASQI